MIENSLDCEANVNQAAKIWISLILLATSPCIAHANGGALCRGYEMITSPQQPPAEPHRESFLWKLTGHGAAPSYLLGSFHSDANQVLNRWEALIVLLDGMQSFAAETSFAQEDAYAFGRLTLTPAPSLPQILGPEFFASARELLQARGLSGDTIERQKPWAAFLQLAQPTGKVQSLDAFLFAQSLQASVPVVALQNPQEMANSAEAISHADQKRILEETICNQGAVAEQVSNLQKLYVNGDVTGFLAEADRLSSPVPGLAKRLTKALVTDRNNIFLPKLDALLHRGGAFIAVGASHLYGENGLLRALESSGYSLEPVERDQISPQLFSRANERASDAADELLGWLRSQNLILPPGMAPPRLAIIPTAELEQKACGGPCQVSIFPQSGNIFLSIEMYHALRNRSPSLMTSLLSQIVRSIQAASLRSAGENHCSAWTTKNIENLILQGKYLASRNLPSAGLTPLTPPFDCIR